MQLRSEIVELIMRFARQIAAHDALIAEATQCFEMLEPMGDKRCKRILQETIAARRSEIIDMRRTIARLANLLVFMPIEDT